MKNEFVLAFNEVLEEKGLPKEIILSALESAMVSAYRRAVAASNNQLVEAKVDPETGRVTIFAEKEVVEDVREENTEVTLDEARRYNPEAELGDLVVVESTPRDFGRVAAQTARQVISQRIRDAERHAQLSFYEKQLGEIVSGVVQAINSGGLTIGLEMKTEASMPRKEMIPGERFHIHDRVRALIAEVKDNPRGPQIILSRTHRNFLRRLLENEVPEIFHGVVEIRSIAREPGERAKVAVSATQQGIDPVGACVGIRGVRIQAIVRELHDEKIDVIEWNPDPAMFIAKAISPARVSGVYLSDRGTGGKTATVVVSEDQLSLAIGRDGQNARLAAKLTGWRIDIKSVSEAAGDVLGRLQSEQSMASIAEAESENMVRVEEILARKAQGKALNPEEYDTLVRFIDRVEKKHAAKVEPVKRISDDELARLREMIPAYAFETDILDAGLPDHVAYLLQEAGYSTLGEMAVQMKHRPDDVLRLNGIGPKAMAEIAELMDRLDAEKQAALEAAEVETEAEVEQPAAEAAVEPELAPEAEAITDLGDIEETIGMHEPELETVAEDAEIQADVADLHVEEEEPSFDHLFALNPDELTPVAVDEEEEEDTSGTDKGKKKGKKKKKKSVTVEFDPDKGTTVARKQHKRGGDWDWEA